MKMYPSASGNLARDSFQPLVEARQIFFFPIDRGTIVIRPWGAIGVFPSSSCLYFVLVFAYLHASLVVVLERGLTAKVDLTQKCAKENHKNRDLMAQVPAYTDPVDYPM